MGYENEAVGFENSDTTNPCLTEALLMSQTVERLVTSNSTLEVPASAAY